LDELFLTNAILYARIVATFYCTVLS
jgi:hypothetical protein